MTINDINSWLRRFNQENYPENYHPYEIDDDNIIVISELGGMWVHKDCFLDRETWLFNRISEDDEFYWVTENCYSYNVYWLKDEIKLNQFVIDYLKEHKNYEIKDQSRP